MNSSVTSGRRGVRLHEIDGLRALAIALVMTHHFVTSKFQLDLVARGQPRIGNAIGFTTNSGVELFFVLSGVVLLRPYLRGLRPFQARQYFQRRIERLWPPYVGALLLGGLVVLIATNQPTWYSRQILPAFSLADWARQLGIVNYGWPIYNLAWWSLTPELTFYLLAPVVTALFALRLWRGSRTLILMAASIVLTIALWNDKTSMTGVQTGIWNSLLQFAAYLPCFFAGAMLAKADLSPRTALALTLGGICYAVLAICIPQANIHAAFALIYAGLVSQAMREGWLHKQLVRPISVWLGERSYSLFLTHFSMLYFADYVASRYFANRSLGYVVATRAAAGIGALVSAMVLFWLVERRFARNLVTASAFWPWEFRLNGNSPALGPPSLSGVSEPGI